MSEVERAEQVASGPRKRFLVNVAGVIAVLAAVGALLVSWYLLQQRAESAEQTTANLAQQVQAACAESHQLLVDNRDVCQRADDAAEAVPAPEAVPGPQGAQGVRGPAGPQGIPGRQGEQGSRGPRGPAGAAGDSGTPGQAGIDGIDGAAGESGAVGPQGATGLQGPAGPAGADGSPGKDGRGIAKVECLSTGDWVFTFTDGAASTVPGPCRTVTATPTPPPSTTKGK